MSLKVFQSYGKAADADVLTLGLSVASKMTNNPYFAHPPGDLTALQVDLEMFSKAIVESVDGSRKVIAEKVKLRQTIIKRLRLLGHYVEAISNDDVAALMSSVAADFALPLRLRSRQGPILPSYFCASP